MPKPYLGAIVLYVIADKNKINRIRPAIITNVDPVNGKVNLTCFTDAANDGIGHQYMAYNVGYDETKQLGTWHWRDDQ